MDKDKKDIQDVVDKIVDEAVKAKTTIEDGAETILENVANIKVKSNDKKHKLEIKELKDKILKLEEEIYFQKGLRNADIANLTKKRNEQESIIRKYGSANLAEDLIKPFDLLKKVVEAPNDNPEVKNYLAGFNMVINQIQNAFENNGIKAMGVKPGDEFNSNIHEANESVESAEFDSNKVVSVISDGYMIHDRVLVHAIVKVSA
ncbi:heat shock protein GrpE [Entomoplasma ellychniae]|uniref:Protein GrpE n=1 Tax=Entomoplasma ellychniae TaxID=2114 RepID=A0A8E2QVJ2_9MOLU|nr:nucleotide exchange factor GrpE [Entomoplasma ellychniae]PPE04466.1 heat shock protein GrpE [Entomoplasma ellychniae]